MDIVQNTAVIDLITNVTDVAALKALPQAGLTDEEYVYMTGESAIYQYVAYATGGQYAPDDQVDDKGFWFKARFVTALDLAGYKDQRYVEIDQKTGLIISAGFTFDGETFSLSANAQRNWDSIKTSKSDYSFPLDITTIDNNTYSLTNPSVQAFWVAARDAVKTPLDSGRVLKKEIFDAIDAAAVQAIVDNR